MADYRSVQTRMWREDDWFQELDIEARLLWIYLFTNPSASPAGIYRLPLRTIAFESGVSYEAAQQLILQFSDDGKAYYEDGVLWVVNMRRLQFPGLVDGSKEWQTATRISRDIDLIPDRCPLKARYLAHSGYPIVNEVIEGGKPSKRVSIQYPNRDDALSMPHATGINTQSVNSNSNVTATVTQTVTETETVTGSTATPSADADTIPHSLVGWSDRIRESKNKSAELLTMFKALYPDAIDIPDFGYIGKTAKDVGGAGRLAELLWINSAKPPSGDVMAYIKASAKNSNGRGGYDKDAEWERKKEAMYGD